jgi:hypothetical protein
MTGPNGAAGYRDEPPACPMNPEAVAWALHALEPDEELAVRAHLPGCSSCRAIVRDTEQIVGALGTQVEQVEPPARLRGDILAAATRSPQVHTDPRPPDLAEAALRTGGEGSARGGRPARAGRRPRMTGRRRLVAAAVAAVAVLGVGGLGVYTAQVQQQRDSQIAQAQSLADLVTQLDRPGSTHATLSTSGGEAVAAVVTTPTDRTVVTAGLPPNDHDATIYVLWGLGAGDPRPLGTFDVAAPEAGLHDMGAVTGQPAFAQYAISLEPGRAMPAAPTVVVASGAVS